MRIFCMLKNVWDVIEINNLSDYHDLYIQSDTLFDTLINDILADV